MFNKIKYIAQREFSIRIKKKSFWILTFLSPLIMSLLMIVPLWLSTDHKSEKTVVFSGMTKEFTSKIPAIDGYSFIFNNTIQANPDSVLSFYKAESELRIENETLIYSTTDIDKKFEQLILTIFENNLLKKDIQTAPLKIKTNYLSSKTQGRFVQELMAYVMGISVYFFIFMYGIQIMKGVVEEKSNRIVEVMLCTVKPFELMMGKIAGISLVGFLQFLLWVGMTIGLKQLISSQLNLDIAQGIDLNAVSSQVNVALIQDTKAYLDVLNSLNLPLIFMGYVWFFLFGFLVYAAYFAAIGSASDIDTDTQQFILPITIPILGTIVLAPSIIAEPDGKLAHFLSWFPLTSPIAMPIRLPFGGESETFGLELIGSGLFLLFFFVFITWIASRIYRIGIMAYGTKTSYKQLIKWFFEKN
jgi:ABC-2 type transport system permease protein